MKISYSKMTNDDFDRIMEDLVGRMTAGELLAIPEVETALREELNNQVLETWEKDNPELAQDWTEEEQAIEKLTRERIVELFESISIQCYDNESTEHLRKDLLENVKDGTLSADDLTE